MNSPAAAPIQAKPAAAGTALVAKKVTKAVFDELSGRKGFNFWFRDQVDYETQRQIKSAVQKRIEQVLEQ